MGVLVFLGGFGQRKTKPIFISPQTYAGGLKKQSQFSPGSIGIKPYLKGDYGNKSHRGSRENKANSKPNLFSPQTCAGG
jgi:hypothetical protein